MGLLSRWRRWREGRQLAGLQVDAALWQQALGDWPLWQQLAPGQRQQLQQLALRFLLRIRLIAIQPVDLDDRLRLRIAGMAVAPVLQLGLDAYAGLRTLIIYPDAFISPQQWQDDAGVVHEELSERSGEAWERGPVVLSLADILASGQGNGYNVVIHELAHVLDMRQQGANGAPLLPVGVSPQRWSQLMQQAWEDLCRREQSGLPLPIDAYALADPAEFFAVLCEHFFDAPQPLRECWPELHALLVDYFGYQPFAGKPV